MEIKASILIIDDRPEKLLALEAVLEDLNQPIVRAYSGREALRHLLSQDFAVILLDVNMPGMDGFETASLIRQRSNSRHTPIIFITAFGDELNAARGYSLGAVDYILAPVLPEVLRTKVSVFVELYIKTEQIKRQAESLRRRAAQMQQLAAGSVAINSALSIESMLQTITDTARDIIGAHQAVAVYDPAESLDATTKTRVVASLSDKYGQSRGRPLSPNALASFLIARKSPAIRLTESRLRMQIDGKILDEIFPPIQGGILATPLTGRGGANLGIIYLSERIEGEFSEGDEAILVQLAQMGSIAIENTVYAHDRQVNRIKDEFLATLSHELRTPLNAIIGWTQLLKMQKLDGEVAHGVDVIDRNARAQTKLIEDLLDVSRITSGKLHLNLKFGSLAAVVRAAIDAIRPAVESKEITLNVNVSDDSEAVYFDPDRIQQVAWNLLSNAIKFTPKGGKVSVDLRSARIDAQEGLTLSVTDNGQGIDPKFVPHVFDRFRQADSASTRLHGGLGIGLYLVRHIIELHGGTVAGQSAGVGAGASFTVTLPIAAHGSTPNAHLQNSRQNCHDHSKKLHLVRVLLVDDEPDARDMISLALRRTGAEVFTAASASEALIAIEGFSPDILVSDIAMPEQDGFALIRRIREQALPDQVHLPAIALTAYAGQEDRDRTRAAGFQAHLSKPVDQSELVNRIHELTTSAGHVIPIPDFE